MLNNSVLPAHMQSFIKTNRLTIRPLSLTDDGFIRQLVNSEGWLRFIGDRNVASSADAQAYIQKIFDNGQVLYWVVERNDNQQAMGVVTLLKRAYLPHADIGFAFLPAFTGKGYAFEAVSAVLHRLVSENGIPHILATVMPDNDRSIKLLTKIGLTYDCEIDIEQTILHVYGAAGSILAQRMTAQPTAPSLTRQPCIE